MDVEKIEEALDVLEIKLNLQVASLEQCLKEVLQNLNDTVRKELAKPKKENVSSVMKKNGLLTISDPDDDDDILIADDDDEDITTINGENDEAYGSFEEDDSHSKQSLFYPKEEEPPVLPEISIENKTKRRDSVEKAWKCRVCLFSSKSKLILLHHVQKLHAGVTSILNSLDASKIDGKKVREIIDRTKRSSKQKGSKPYQCQVTDDCNYAPGTNSKLQRHIRSVHENIKDISCPECEFKTGRRDHLAKHLKKHHSESLNPEIDVKHESKTTEFEEVFPLT